MGNIQASMLLRSPAQGMHNSCKPHYWEAPWAVCKQLHDQSGPHHPLLTYVTSGYGGGDLIKYMKAPEPISPMSLVGAPSLQWEPQLLGFNVLMTHDRIQPNSTTTVDLPTDLIMATENDHPRQKKKAIN